jgi:endo-1,4-beta-xylanase
VILLPLSLLAEGNSNEILLWPNGAPGAEGKSGEEIVKTSGNGDRRVSHINKPSITFYVPPPDKATGAAVIIAPGGGHSFLSIDSEGYNIAQWLSEHGVAGFVLKYRLARETNSTYTLDRDEMADMRRSIRLVRSRAGEWGVKPERIGVIGFSAGGELAFKAAMVFDNGTPDAPAPIDRQSSKPDFQALIYPGNSKSIDPSSNSPPVFLACGNNDRPDISQGLASVYLSSNKSMCPPSCTSIPASATASAGALMPKGRRQPGSTASTSGLASAAS